MARFHSDLQGTDVNWIGDMGDKRLNFVNLKVRCAYLNIIVQTFELFGHQNILS